jgi:hypothetical protein
MRRQLVGNLAALAESDALPAAEVDRERALLEIARSRLARLMANPQAEIASLERLFDVQLRQLRREEALLTAGMTTSAEIQTLRNETEMIRKQLADLRRKAAINDQLRRAREQQLSEFI